MASPWTRPTGKEERPGQGATTHGIATSEQGETSFERGEAGIDVRVRNQTRRLRFDIITIFPDFFAGILDHGILSRAIFSGVVAVETVDLRSFTADRHRTVDDRPFGGGEGMVLKPGPIFEAVESLRLAEEPIPGHALDAKSALIAAEPPLARSSSAPRHSVVLLSAQGEPFTQTIAHELASLERIVFICGRYEGVDERVADLLCDREISIGDYVLSGGELAAAVIIDAVTRLLPGVLGNADSAHFESFGSASGSPRPDSSGVPASTHPAAGLLDYPHYTRPADFRGHSIPDVLKGGNHTEIRRWRRQAALAKTLRNRPDLLRSLTSEQLSEADRLFLSSKREEADR